MTLWRHDHLPPLSDIEMANGTLANASDLVNKYVKERAPLLWAHVSGNHVCLVGMGRTFLDDRGHRTRKRCSVAYGDWSALDKRIQEANTKE